MYKVGRSRTPQGVRGLKPPLPSLTARSGKSHSARSAWIETVCEREPSTVFYSRTPQGVRGLKPACRIPAWLPEAVALRKECVD